MSFNSEAIPAQPSKCPRKNKKRIIKKNNNQWVTTLQQKGITKLFINIHTNARF